MVTSDHTTVNVLKRNIIVIIECSSENETYVIGSHLDGVSEPNKVLDEYNIHYIYIELIL